MINKDEKISVIVPIYNVKEQYFKKCMQSITIQTYPNIEIILINDGSDEECKKIINEYVKKDERVIYIEHQKNQGISQARNSGIKIAKGEWIIFIDADDYVENNFCEEMLNVAKDTNSECVACAYNRIYRKKIEKVQKKCNFIMNNKQFFEEILNVQSGLGFCHMKLWKADIIKKNNIQFNKELNVAEDALFCMKTSKYLNNIYFLNKTLYNYRFNSKSIVRKFDKMYVYKYLCAMKFQKEYVQKEWKNYEKEFYNYVLYHVLLIVVNYCFHPKNKNKGIGMLKEICNIKEFKDAIKYSNYTGLSITRKITVFTLKYKLYIITSIIANIRQLQFAK